MKRETHRTQQPKYIHQIDEGAGNAQQSDSLVQWMAWFPQTDRHFRTI